MERRRYRRTVTYQHARLTLERSGGFAGLTATDTVDTEQLDAKRREAYLTLLAGLDLTQLTRGSRERPGHADEFQYDLRLDLDGTRQQLRFGESTQTTELKKLVQMITADSRGH